MVHIQLIQRRDLDNDWLDEVKYDEEDNSVSVWFNEHFYLSLPVEDWFKIVDAVNKAYPLAKSRNNGNGQD